MSYKDALVDSYILDSNNNVNKINIIASDDKHHFVVPKNQITMKPKDAIYLTREDAVYASIKNKLKAGQTSSSITYRDIYADTLAKVKGDFPELFL